MRVPARSTCVLTAVCASCSTCASVCRLRGLWRLYPPNGTPKPEPFPATPVRATGGCTALTLACRQQTAPAPPSAQSGFKPVSVPQRRAALAVPWSWRSLQHRLQLRSLSRRVLFLGLSRRQHRLRRRVRSVGCLPGGLSYQLAAKRNLGLPPDLAANVRAFVRENQQAATSRVNTRHPLLRLLFLQQICLSAHLACRHVQKHCVCGLVARVRVPIAAVGVRCHAPAFRVFDKPPERHGGLEAVPKPAITKSCLDRGTQPALTAIFRPVVIEPARDG